LGSQDHLSKMLHLLKDYKLRYKDYSYIPS
jgi:hypothetical protein